MRKVIVWILISIVFILIGWFANVAYRLPKNSNPISQIKPTPLLKYSIENLSARTFAPSQIEIGEAIKEYPEYTTYKFKMQFSPDFSNNLKTVSGVINIPTGNGPFPAIVMFRGFVNQEEYTMGAGTQPSARIFAKNGYITIAPDFLGYGESDTEAIDIFESRFQTYVTAVTLLKTVESYVSGATPVPVQLTNLLTNQSSIFIWGHSNGGQIALTTLEITGASYPTVLWAPVTMRFPASILYYIEDADDGGKFLIAETAKFEETYDAEVFSLTNYLDKIKAPILLNQGTGDTSVPFWTNDAFTKIAEEKDVDITYTKYSGANHSLVPSWDLAVTNSLSFYKSHLIK